MPLSGISKSRLQRFDAASSERHGIQRLRLLVFAAALVIGMVFTWLVFHLAAANARARNLLDFKQEAVQMDAQLQSQFDLSLEHLRTIPGFFEASDDVSRDDFSTFVSDAVRRHSSIYTFEYLPRVAEADRETFESQARKIEGLSDFAIRAVDDGGNEVDLETKPFYFPVYYAEPVIEGVLGIDLGSHPEQGVYVDKACVSDQPVATHPLSLIEDPDDVLSVIALNPVRFSRLDADIPCDGIAVLILRIRPVVETAMGPARLGEFQLVLSDPDAKPSRQLVYKNFPGQADTIHRAGWPLEEHEIRFADQAWTLSMAPAEGSPLAPRRAPYWLLVTGTLLSLLAAHGVSASIAIGGLRKQVDAALEIGQYRLGNKLGEGGMGTVYEARHQMLARPAAIKLIRPEDPAGDGLASGASKSQLDRFEKEAQATARLESPHTISIYDFGEAPDGSFYYVMELLHGKDLSTLVKDFGRLPPPRVIDLLRQVCRSLAEAHQTGLIHRDIKPANIFVCKYALQYDFVKVLDFGLVKSNKNEQSVELTQPGSLLGTPAYMAPEMMTGDKVDARADLYSLGCVAFWLLTGKSLFEGGTATAVMLRHLTQSPPSPRAVAGEEVSEQLDAIVLGCLEKKPEDRPQTAEQLEQQLASCAGQAPWGQPQAKDCWDQQMKDLDGAAETQPSGLDPTLAETSDR